MRQRMTSLCDSRGFADQMETAYRSIWTNWLRTKQQPPANASNRPNVMTLVILMGFRQRAKIATYLIERGGRADTPVALLLAASTDHAERWVGTLEELSGETPELDENTSPGTLVVGDVVNVAEEVRGLMCADTKSIRDRSEPIAMRI